MKKGRKIKKIVNVEELIDIIGAECANRANGPESVEYKLWDGRIVTSSYNRTNKDADEYFKENIVYDERLNSLAEKLLSGKSFVIDTGIDDWFCSLEWTIREAE